MAIFILPLLSARDLDIGPRQITRRKLCFYYTCKFGVISIKYVIMHNTLLTPSISSVPDEGYSRNTLNLIFTFLLVRYIPFILCVCICFCRIISISFSTPFEKLCYFELYVTIGLRLTFDENIYIFSVHTNIRHNL
jgi:hypothetical protein